MELTTYAGRNNPLALRILADDPVAGTTDQPLAGAAVTRTVLVLDPGTGTSILIDSAVDAAAFDWSTGNGIVIIDLLSTTPAIPAGTQQATLIVFDADNTDGVTVAEFTHHRVPDALA